MHSQLQFDSLRRGELDVGLVRYNESAPGRHPAARCCGATRCGWWCRPGTASRGASRCRSPPAATRPSSAFPATPAPAPARCSSASRREAGFEPRIAQEAREATTQIGLVAAGLGIAVLPAPLEAVRIEGVHYVPLEGEGALLVMSAATRSDEASERVLGFVRRVSAIARAE